MKVAQLLESELGELAAVLMLRKHGQLSQQDAKELHGYLQNFTFTVSNRRVPANLKWVEDKLTGTVKFISSNMPGSWRSSSAAMSRHRLVELLRRYGFQVGRFQVQAAERVEATNNGPHIFFWGPGTPPMKPENMKKVTGTKEWHEAIKAAVSKDKHEG